MTPQKRNTAKRAIPDQLDLSEFTYCSPRGRIAGMAPVWATLIDSPYAIDRETQ
jgi:hypothetical protein